MRKILLAVCCLLFAFLQVHAQNSRTISGRVTDDKGNPLSGVSVTAGNSGTITNATGNYSLRVPSGTRSVTFSYVGFASVTQNINNSGTVNLSLAAEDKNLSEVVVVGYGVQKRSSVTDAVGKINAAPIANLVTPSVDKQLGGRTAGVQVTNSSGLVNQPPRIRIRGANSISGSRDPLIVLDGVPIFSGGASGVANDNLLSDINPADIESIDVLKDGSATAIYGSRGANGVIMITTKKGKLGSSSKVTYSTTFGYSQPLKRFDLLNATDFVTIANEKFTNAGLTAPAVNPNGYNTNWQDIIFRKTALSQIHNLSVEGGSDRTTFYFSMNYATLQGLLVTNSTQRVNVRANIEHRINKWVKLSNFITLSRDVDQDQNNGGNSLSGAIYNAIRALPDVRATDPTNTKFSGFNVTPDGAALGADQNLRQIDNNNSNIAYVLAKNKFRSSKFRIIDNVGLEVKPFSWLTYTAKANVDVILNSDFLSYDPYHGDGKGGIGDVYNAQANTTRWVLQNYLTFNKKFNNHNVTLVAGSEQQDQKGNSFSGEGTNVSDVFFIQNNLISGSYVTQYSSGSYSEGPSFQSFFGRLNYDYKGKYFLQGSFRRDGMSKLAPDRRFGNFPGVSAGYRVSQEKFWNTSGLSKVFSDFKIRGSWARVGNINIAGGNFPYLSTYGVAPYGAISGIAANLQGNSSLTWETNEKINAGADISLLGGRLGVTVDYFKNKNNGLVFAVPLPPSYGVPGNSIYKNIGNMENSGIEASINASIIKTRDFTWDVSVNFTHQNNKVLTLPADQDIPVSGGAGGTYNLLREGQSIYVLYGYQYAGVNKVNGNPQYYKADGTLIQGNVANSSYFLVNPDGSLGAATTLAGSDRVLLGSPLAKYFGGISTGFSFKGFSLDMLFRYAGGNKIMNITAQESIYNQGFTNSGTAILNRWTKSGDVTSVPKLWYGRDNFLNLTQSASTRFIENGDFIRLDNLMLSYTVPFDVLKRATRDNVKSVRIFVQGQNLWLKTKYTGIDPDNINEQGLDYNTSPPARTISFGLSVGF